MRLFSRMRAAYQLLYSPLIAMNSWRYGYTRPSIQLLPRGVPVAVASILLLSSLLLFEEVLDVSLLSNDSDAADRRAWYCCMIA